MKTAVARGAVMIGVSRLLANIIGLVMNVVLARTLTPADFGLVALAGTIWNFLLSATELQISTLLLQLDAITTEHFHAAWTIDCLRSLLLSGVMCGLAVPISIFYHDDRLVPISLFMGLSILVGLLRSPRIVEFNKRLAFDVQTKIFVAQRLLGASTTIVLAITTHSYWALMFGTLASDLCGTVMSQVYARYRPRFSIHLWRFFLKQGFWLSATQFVSSLHGRFDTLALGYFTDKPTVGRYTLGSTIGVLAARESLAPLTQTLLPSFTLLRGDPARIRHAYQRAQALVFAIALPAGVGTALLAPALVHHVLGDRWSGSEIVIRTIAVLSALQTFGFLSRPLAMAYGDNRCLSRQSFLTLLVRVPVITIGLYLYGLPGCLVGLCITTAVDIVSSAIITRRLAQLSLKAQLHENVVTLVASLAMTACVLLVQRQTDPSGYNLGFALLQMISGMGSYLAARALVVRLWVADSLADREALVLFRQVVLRRAP